jgi:predicted phosphodiesterase
MQKTIQVISDVHTEFGLSPEKFRKLLVKADITVLAGDIVNHAFKLKEYLEVAKEFSPNIIFICGNHEYYKKSTDAEYRQVCLEVPGVHFIQRDRVCVEGIWFTGATLWSNISDFAGSIMNDPFDVIEIRAKHMEDLGWLEENIEEGDVVVTHHLPSLKLIHDKYKNSPFNSGFATDLDDLIDESKPKIWIAGHTHFPFDLMHNETTRLVVNPVGYPGENKDFAIKIIEFEVN